MPRIDEQRASTPTIDERRDPMSSQVKNTQHNTPVEKLVPFLTSPPYKSNSYKPCLECVGKKLGIISLFIINIF